MSVFIATSIIINAAPSSDNNDSDKATPNVQASDQQEQKDQTKNNSTSLQDSSNQDDPKLTKAVKEALEALKNKSPQVHEDSLRVWKNFKSKSKPPNYTYRSWGRQLILWLKDEKDIIFQTEQDVKAVFMVLYHMNMISEHAVVVLTVDTWGHLVYLEGMPDWEKRKENLADGKEVVPNGINHKVLDTPV